MTSTAASSTSRELHTSPAQRHALAETGVGKLLLVADGDRLTGLYFDGHWHPPAAGSIGDKVDDTTSDPVFAATLTQLEEYLDGRRTTFDVPVRTRGDKFQEKVWQMLRQLPYGTTTTYGALAARLGDPSLAREVGQAVGRNPVSIVIGCHRVVGSDGRLVGYAGGLARKRRLLELEASSAAAEGTLF